MMRQIAYNPSAYVLPRMPVTLEADMIGKASSNAEAQHAAAPGRRKVALALQSGGSRLLDDETIEIIGVTGTSAGAMNGALTISHY